MSDVTIQFGKTVTLRQAAQLIATTPKVHYLLEGEPGIGKSSVLPMILALLDGYVGSYSDVGNMDLGDVACPIPDHQSRTMRYYPNARFKITEGKPVVIMLDEFTKGSAPVKNMLHPLLESKAPRLGDMLTPEGTITFLTGNLSTDGVGDSLPAHSRNRITVLRVSKPSADEWLAWAADNDIDPVIMAWVRAYPHALASYTDGGQESNPYIYNPRKVQKSFVSPRSLEHASDITKARDKNDPDAVLTALAGTIGEAGAKDLEAYIAHQDQLPAWKAIITDPKNAVVPTSPAACSILAYSAIQKVDSETITPWMEYLERMDHEWQAVFIINLAKHAERQKIGLKSQSFRDWVFKNQDLL